MNRITDLDLEELSSKDPKIKYGRAKKLIATAAEDPVKLHPHAGFIIGLLDHGNQILKWTAIDVLGNLIKTDKTKKLDRFMGRLYGFLDAGKMITAGHAVTALTGIAQAKPEFRKRIVSELLKVEGYEYDTAECKNIAIGHVILALGSFYDGLDARDRRKVSAFVKRHVNNKRRATGKKAGRVLRMICKNQ